MIKLNAAQLERFDQLYAELEALAPAPRRARLDEIAADDPGLAAALGSALVEPPSLRGLKHGDRIGACTLDKCLGMGGCGEVWLAQQKLVGQSRDVAVKLIRPDHLLGADATDYLARFPEEIAILKDLRGEGIVHLYDAGTVPLPGGDRKVPYIVMEYVPGKPLTEALRGRDVRTQVECFCDVCDAMQRAHNQGSGRLHLDLKPQNVLVIEASGELTPKVLDFGLAQCFDPVRRVVVEHFGSGTLPYMAPEQLDPKLGGPDFRTDVHALGVMLFQILTGHLPHNVPEGAASGYVRAIGQGPRQQLLEVRKLSPIGLTDARWQSLEAIVGRAMAVKREERYHNPGELAKALAVWLQQPSPPSHPPEPELVSLIAGPDAAREFATLVQRLIIHQGRLHGFKVEIGPRGAAAPCWIRQGNFLGLEPVIAVYPRWTGSGPVRDPVVTHGVKQSEREEISASGRPNNFLLVFPGDPGKYAASSKGTTGPRASGEVVSVGSETCLEWLRACPPLLARYRPQEAARLPDASGFSGKALKSICAMYCELDLPRHRDLRLIGVPTRLAQQRYEAGTIPLEQVFVPQRFVPSGESVAQARPLSYLFGALRPKVLLGDPGCGKTTILHYLALVHAGETESGGSFVPLFLSLRDFSRGRKERPTFVEALAEQARTLGMASGDAHPWYFQSLLEMGEAIVLLDGLDEAGDEAARMELARLIEALQREYPLCPLWVTSRIVGYSGAARLDAKVFDHFEVALFGTEERRAFVTKWFEAEFPDRPAEREDHAQTLLRALDVALPQVQELAGNPLLLTLMVLIHRQRQHLPESRGELYDEAVEMLLHHREKDRFRGEPTPLEQLQPPIDANEARWYLTLIAWAAQKANERKGAKERGNIPRSLILDELIPLRAPKRGGNADAAKADIEVFLEYIRARTGLLNWRGQDTYAFVHLSFQEHLAARQLADDQDKRAADKCDFFFESAAMPAWRETALLLLYRLQMTTSRTPFLDLLMSQARRREEDGSLLGDALWRTLGMAVRDNLNFLPSDADLILSRLLTAWLAEPKFEGETYAVLAQVSTFAARRKTQLVGLLRHSWRESESPMHALSALHLRVRLLGWPAADATESQHLAKELEDRLALGQKLDQEAPLLKQIVRILAEAGVDKVATHETGARCVQVVQTRLLGRLVHADLPVRARADAGIVLCKLGDPRPGVGLKHGLPQFVWCGSDGEQPVDQPLDFQCAFPAKPFLMGGDPGAWGSSKEPFECTRIGRAFFLSKFPVTVAQYQAFVDRGGYGEPTLDAAKPLWWTEAGWAWRNGKSATTDSDDFVKRMYAENKHPILHPPDVGAVFQTPNHPRVAVSWHEALAFCRWLTERLREAAWPGWPKGAWVRLPTDAEWELAARWSAERSGVDGRIFPWGNPAKGEQVKEHLTARCNWDGTGLGHTSAVGLFPNGVADCGVADLTGNVWEWCQSKWVALEGHGAQGDYNHGKSKAKDLDDNEGEESGERVLRGGSWGDSRPDRLRAAYRNLGRPGLRGLLCGFRVVVDVGECR